MWSKIKVSTNALKSLFSYTSGHKLSYFFVRSRQTNRFGAQLSNLNVVFLLVYYFVVQPSANTTKVTCSFYYYDDLVNLGQLKVTDLFQSII